MVLEPVKMKEFDSKEFINKMRGEYLAGIEKKIGYLEKLFIQLWRGRGNKRTIGELYQAVYALSGSGETFGYPLITKAAEFLMVDLKELKKNPGIPGNYFFINFLDFISTLRFIYSHSLQGEIPDPKDIPWLSNQLGLCDNDLSGTQIVFRDCKGKIFLLSERCSLKERIKKLVMDAGFAYFESENIFTAFTQMDIINPDVIIIGNPDEMLTTIEASKLIRLKTTYDSIPILLFPGEGGTNGKTPRNGLIDVDILSDKEKDTDLLIKISSHFQRSRIQKYLKVIDPVTGLYNHRFFFRKISAGLLDSKQHGTSLTIAIIQVETLKELNDKFGFKMGDVFFKRVGEFFMTSLRESDIVARYRANKLAILLPRTDPFDARKVLDRLQELIETLQFPHSGFQYEDITCKFVAGLAGYPEHGNTLLELMERVDHALEEAVVSGKNVVFGW